MRLTEALFENLFARSGDRLSLPLCSSGRQPISAEPGGRAIKRSRSMFCARSRRDIEADGRVDPQRILAGRDRHRRRLSLMGARATVTARDGRCCLDVGLPLLLPGRLQCRRASLGDVLISPPSGQE
jgi:hypothetical protein